MVVGSFLTMTWEFQHCPFSGIRTPQECSSKNACIRIRMNRSIRVDKTKSKWLLRKQVRVQQMPHLLSSVWSKSFRGNQSNEVGRSAQVKQIADMTSSSVNPDTSLQHRRVQCEFTHACIACMPKYGIDGQ